MILWDRHVEAYSDLNNSSIVAFKGVKINDFAGFSLFSNGFLINKSSSLGRALATISSSSFVVNPEMHEAKALRRWYSQYHRSLPSASDHSPPFCTLHQAKANGYGKKNQPEYFSILATILYINSDVFSYPVCSEKGCLNVVKQGEGQGWKCHDCDATFKIPKHQLVDDTNYQTRADFIALLQVSSFYESLRQFWAHKNACIRRDWQRHMRHERG